MSTRKVQTFAKKMGFLGWINGFNGWTTVPFFLFFGVFFVIIFVP